jgi:hypothetical protein
MLDQDPKHVSTKEHAYDTKRACSTRYGTYTTIELKRKITLKLKEIND